MELIDVVDRVQWGNSVDVHFNGPLSIMAQDYKLWSGQNALMPDDIADSTGASEVDTLVAFCIPFFYADPRAPRSFDNIYPTTLLQDANLTIHFNNDASLIGDANSHWDEGRLRVEALTVSLNRAVIPLEPEVGYIDFNAMHLPLSKGLYKHVWLTKFARDDFYAFDTIRMDADGMEVVPARDIDLLVPAADFDICYKDDELQQYIDYSTGVAIDANIPPQPTDVTLDYFFAPVYFDAVEAKLGRLLAVENRLHINLTGTQHAIRACYRKYHPHTAAGIDKKAEIMGFGPGTIPAPRTNRRKLKGKDIAMRWALPVRLEQATPNK